MESCSASRRSPVATCAAQYLTIMPNARSRRIAGGEFWFSGDESAHWENVVRHLPEIHALEMLIVADN